MEVEGGEERDISGNVPPGPLDGVAELLMGDILLGSE
jgi:hypothetical protein